jgi:hypothetical protein
MIVSFVVPEMAKLTSWVQFSPKRKTTLRVISIVAGLVAAGAGVALGEDVGVFSGLLETALYAGISFLTAYIQHKITKSART